MNSKQEREIGRKKKKKIIDDRRPHTRRERGGAGTTAGLLRCGRGLHKKFGRIYYGTLTKVRGHNTSSYSGVEGN